MFSFLFVQRAPYFWCHALLSLSVCVQSNSTIFLWTSVLPFFLLSLAEQFLLALKCEELPPARALGLPRQMHRHSMLLKRVDVSVMEFERALAWCLLLLQANGNCCGGRCGHGCGFLSRSRKLLQLLVGGDFAQLLLGQANDPALRAATFLVAGIADGLAQLGGLFPPVATAWLDQIGQGGQHRRLFRVGLLGLDNGGAVLVVPPLHHGVELWARSAGAALLADSFVDGDAARLEASVALRASNQLRLHSRNGPSAGGDERGCFLGQLRQDIRVAGGALTEWTARNSPSSLGSVLARRFLVGDVLQKIVAVLEGEIEELLFRDDALAHGVKRNHVAHRVFLLSLDAVPFVALQGLLAEHTIASAAVEARFWCDCFGTQEDFVALVQAAAVSGNLLLLNDVLRSGSGHGFRLNFFLCLYVC
jgi:hypothetical protein